MRVRLAGLSVVTLLLLLIGVPRTQVLGDSGIGGDGTIRWGVSKRKGFDKCSAPTASQMQTWWTYSPYWDIGIYIGGPTRACSQPNLTSSWATTVHRQGWSYYLTWVGRQPPNPECQTSREYSSEISLDPSTARSQGRTAANGAVTAARGLGFTGKNVIYLDIEGYDKTKTNCRNAITAYVQGWVSRLNNHTYPQKAAVYAGPCTSNMDYWWSVTNRPFAVWAARWNGDPDVWGLGCGLTDSMWSNHRRLHQYAGDVSETWGGLTFTIDRDCADGPVTPHGHATEDTACTQE